MKDVTKRHLKFLAFAVGGGLTVIMLVFGLPMLFIKLIAPVPTSSQQLVVRAAKAQNLTVYAGSVALDQPEGKLLVGQASVRIDDVTARMFFWQLDKNTWVFGCRGAEGRLVPIQDPALRKHFLKARLECPAGTPPKMPSR